MSPSGVFLFSVEQNHGSEPWQLLKSMRHAHSSSYIEALLARNNLTLVLCEDAVIRNEGGKPVAGLLYLAQKRTND
jgi:predicted TPR repeat methyltransferase